MRLNKSVFAPGLVLTGKAPTRSKVEFAVLSEAHSMSVEKSIPKRARRSASKRGSRNWSANARASVIHDNRDKHKHGPDRSSNPALDGTGGQRATQHSGGSKCCPRQN